MRAKAMVYQKGDKIVYPLYGAGVIEGLEDGYYVLTIPIGNLKIMISAEKAEGLTRYVLPREELLSNLTPPSNAINTDNWNQRYKENMNRIKSGEIPQVVFVFHSLLMRERCKGLSTAEKKMMTTAKQIILSELILSLEIEKSEAEGLLVEAFTVKD